VAAMEAMFPESSRVRLPYPLEIVELAAEEPRPLGAITVTPYIVEHPTTGAPPLALRIECDGRIIAYSGDTVWTESLHRAARDADLFVVEAYLFDRKTRLHMDYQTLATHLPDVTAKRVVLTHLGADMLTRAPTLPYESAEDGKVIEV
jgi:ribonuclease BN (tRNA processing enzyme)